MDDDAIRDSMLRADHNCQRYLLQSMQEYGYALQLGNKHLFQALPRLLMLWFDFVSIIPVSEVSNAEGKTSKAKASSDQCLADQQHEANALMAEFLQVIPPHSFYTVLPQLISRVMHRDEDTARIVRAILTKVLEKFPPQSMWALGWLRHSVHSTKKKVGEEIFKNAQKALRRKEDMKMHDLLVASKRLFQFLINLAELNPSNPNARTFRINPWKGEVDLMEFVPPVQAALSISPASSSCRDAFPAFVPRMRSFSSQIQVMSSKARPKKITAFAIPAGKQRYPSSSSKNHLAQPGDIGEIHFLVKQEAKGDLRKDARVQDLNNVINRLLMHNVGSRKNASRQRRRLHLRTFSVVCLKEDCGMLEWVPNTDSFRNLVSSSYNPQADPHSIRRRGRRIANFSDVSLRTSFEKCQNLYFKNGSLVRAAETFRETCLKQYPPLLYWWFVKEFLDPHAWFEARTAFTLSAAAWSAVGHVIGLGDRHSENILVDTKSGDCVHVDFDW